MISKWSEKLTLSVLSESIFGSIKLQRVNLLCNLEGGTQLPPPPGQHFFITQESLVLYSSEQSLYSSETNMPLNVASEQPQTIHFSGSSEFTNQHLQR